MAFAERSLLDLDRPTDIAEQLERFTFNGQPTIIEDREGVRF